MLHSAGANGIGCGGFGRTADFGVAGDEVDVVHERQGPGSDVVDFVGEFFCAPAFLLGEEILFHGNIGIEEDADHEACRLGEGDDVTACRIGLARGGEVARRALHFDALLDEKRGEFIDEGGVAGIGQDIVPKFVSWAIIDGGLSTAPREEACS